MAFNNYLSLGLSGLAANLPTSVDNPTVPRTYYATDTNAVYMWNPVKVGGAGWDLLYQLKPVTFANLPTTGKIIGTEATVTDATTPTKGGIITGGSNVLTGAVWDGTNWRAV